MRELPKIGQPEELFAFATELILAGDAQSLAMLYTEDAVLTVVNEVTGQFEGVFRGRAAIEQQFAGCFSKTSFLENSRPLGGRYRVTSQGDTATYSGPSMARLISYVDGQAYRVWGDSTEVFQNSADGWKIVFDNSNVVEHQLDTTTGDQLTTQFENIFGMFRSDSTFKGRVQDHPLKTIQEQLGFVPALTKARIHQRDKAKQITLDELQDWFPLPGALAW